MLPPRNLILALVLLPFLGACYSVRHHLPGHENVEAWRLSEPPAVTLRAGEPALALSWGGLRYWGSYAPGLASGDPAIVRVVLEGDIGSGSFELVPVAPGETVVWYGNFFSGFGPFVEERFDGLEGETPEQRREWLEEQGTGFLVRVVAAK